MSRFFGATAKPYGGRNIGGGGAFGGVGGGAFVPTDVAGLLVWADASQVTGKVNNDAVSQLDDSSGNGFHFTQATGANQPLYKTSQINGQPVLEFDGSNDVLRSSYQNADQSITLFVVGRFLSGVAANRRILGLGPSEASIFYQATGTQFGYYANSASGVQDLGGVATDATILALVFASAASVVAYRDGASVATFDPHDIYHLSGTAALTLGAQDAGSEFAKCQIGEVLIYNSALSASDRGDVTTYLGDKWGITVA